MRIVYKVLVGTQSCWGYHSRTKSNYVLFIEVVIKCGKILSPFPVHLSHRRTNMACVCVCVFVCQRYTHITHRFPPALTLSAHRDVTVSLFPHYIHRLNVSHPLSSCVQLFLFFFSKHKKLEAVQIETALEFALPSVCLIKTSWNWLRVFFFVFFLNCLLLGSWVMFLIHSLSILG